VISAATMQPIKTLLLQ